MKRLRLIKPWRLRVVRQSLGEREYYNSESISFIPCCGPRSEAEDISSLFEPQDFRIRKDDGRSANRNNMPVSDVIYTINKSIR